MNQEEKRSYLIEKLVAERPEFDKLQIPTDEMEQRTLLRSLMNLRLPAPMDETFLRIQDDYLKRLLKEKGIVEIKDMDELAQNVFVWKGDITRLRVGAIVNAANSGMTGCYQPCHNCIDNCIHTYAGIQLRLKCAEIMEEQGYEEPTGQAKITPAYNLPCDYVIHTVGPIVRGGLTETHERQLASCYWNCLKIADENNVESIAFCCISTGVFMFPNARAAEIAVGTLERYKKETGSSIKVVFNVFKDEDERLYRDILCHH
jgi:O-acetyl-ADP-ribose deacetylase (regulator of RNase III)